MKIGNVLPINFNVPNGIRRYSNLAPLPYDTVSFGGQTKETEPVRPRRVDSKSDKKKIDQSDRVPLKNAQGLYLDSDYAFAQLKFILNNTFGENLIDIDSPNAQTRIERAMFENKDKPIVCVTGRRKSPESIVEKMASKHLRSKKDAKEDLHDLIGARVVVSGTSTREGDYVIEKLTDAVKKGRIKLDEVKLHGQDNPKLNYATKAKLNKLVETARKNGSPMCKYTDEPRDTGYLALHINTGEIADGYKAEIQIMGVDISEFKEVEDLVYKIRSKKNVPAKYEPIKNLFASLKTQQAQERYNEYTKRAYAYERLKPIHEKDDYADYLPAPDDLGIPPELDFNNIAKLKRKIDRSE